MYKPIFVVEKKLKLALQIFASGRPEKLQTLRVCNFIWRPSAKIRKAASAFFDNKNRLSIGIYNKFLKLKMREWSYTQYPLYVLLFSYWSFPSSYRSNHLLTMNSIPSLIMFFFLSFSSFSCCAPFLPAPPTPRAAGAEDFFFGGSFFGGISLLAEYLARNLSAD